MLNGHTDPISLRIYAETQTSAMFTSHAIANYVPETNLPTELSICQICKICFGNMGDGLHIWATDEVNGINHVTRSNVH